MADGGNTLKIALGTKKLLHGDILSLLDLDSDASDVTVSLTAESQNVGHFEIDRFLRSDISILAHENHDGHEHKHHCIQKPDPSEDHIRRRLKEGLAHLQVDDATQSRK